MTAAVMRSVDMISLIPFLLVRMHDDRLTAFNDKNGGTVKDLASRLLRCDLEGG